MGLDFTDLSFVRAFSYSAIGVKSSKHSLAKVGETLLDIKVLTRTFIRKAVFLISIKSPCLISLEALAFVSFTLIWLFLQASVASDLVLKKRVDQSHLSMRAVSITLYV